MKNPFSRVVGTSKSKRMQLLGVEREEDATALFPLFWGTWKEEAEEIVMKRGLTSNKVCPHWILDVSAITQNRNNKYS